MIRISAIVMNQSKLEQYAIKACVAIFPWKIQNCVLNRQGDAPRHFRCPKSDLLIEFLEHGHTNNSDVYYQKLRSLNKSMKNKRPKLIANGVILHHNKARPHVSRTTQSILVRFNWEQLEHLPYNLEMSQYDFHVFGSLKNISMGSASTRTTNWSI